MNHSFGIDDLVVTPTHRLARVTALIPILPTGVWRAEISYLDAEDSACIKAGLLRPSTLVERERVYKEQRIVKRKLEDDEIVPPCPTLYHLLLLMYVPPKEATPTKTPQYRRNVLVGREEELMKLWNEREAKGYTQQKMADMLGVTETSIRRKIAAMKKRGFKF